MASVDTVRPISSALSRENSALAAASRAFDPAAEISPARRFASV